MCGGKQTGKWLGWFTGWRYFMCLSWQKCLLWCMVCMFPSTGPKNWALGRIYSASIHCHRWSPSKLSPSHVFLVETQRLQATSSPRSASFETAPARWVLVLEVWESQVMLPLKRLKLMQYHSSWCMICQGSVNVPFWSFLGICFTSPSNICWRLYPQ